MAREIDLTSREWCNVIFEGKHQEYGAYLLRETSSRRHVAAFFVIAAFALFALSGYYVTRILSKPEPRVIADGYGAYYIDHPAKPKQNEIPKPVEPEVAVKPKLNTVAMVKPVIVDDENVKNELESMEKINNDPRTISTESYAKGVNDGGVYQPEADPVPTESEVDNNIVNWAEQNPVFPGGDTELFKFLNSNIRYPQYELENEIQGKVVCQFVVGLDGSIQDITVIKGVSKGLDREAMRVIGLMPRWIPGKQGGNNVRVRYMLPVTFRIQPQ